MSPSGSRAGGSSSRLAVRGGFVGRLAGNRTGSAERSGYQRPSVAVDLAGGFITNLSVLISLVMRRLPKKETRKSCVTEGETWRSAAGRRAWRSSFPALPTRAGAHGPARPAGAGMLPSEPRRGRPQGGVEGEGLGAGFAQSSASRSGRGRFAAGGGAVLRWWRLGGARGSAAWGPLQPSGRPSSRYTWPTCPTPPRQTREADSSQTLEVGAWPIREPCFLSNGQC